MLPVYCIFSWHLFEFFVTCGLKCNLLHYIRFLNCQSYHKLYLQPFVNLDYDDVLIVLMIMGDQLSYDNILQSKVTL